MNEETIALIEDFVERWPRLEKGKVLAFSQGATQTLWFACEVNEFQVYLAALIDGKGRLSEYLCIFRLSESTLIDKLHLMSQKEHGDGHILQLDEMQYEISGGEDPVNVIREHLEYHLKRMLDDPVLCAADLREMNEGNVSVNALQGGAYGLGKSRKH